jgi:hypothetical protein
LGGCESFCEGGRKKFLTQVYDSYIVSLEMNPVLPRQKPQTDSMPGKLPSRLEAQLRKVAKELGLSRDQVLLLSLQSGLDKMTASSSSILQGAPGSPVS